MLNDTHKSHHEGVLWSRAFDLRARTGLTNPGMLAPWLELPGARDQIALWSKLASLDLEHLGTTATADEITDTAGHPAAHRGGIADRLR